MTLAAMRSWRRIRSTSSDRTGVRRAGQFQAGDTADMLLRNTSTGGFQAYYISGNTITGSALVGTVGTNWNFAGIGDFDGAEQLVRTVAAQCRERLFELYQVAGGGVLWEARWPRSATIFRSRALATSPNPHDPDDHGGQPNETPAPGPARTVYLPALYGVVRRHRSSAWSATI